MKVPRAQMPPAGLYSMRLLSAWPNFPGPLHRPAPHQDIPFDRHPEEKGNRCNIIAATFHEAHQEYYLMQPTTFHAKMNKVAPLLCNFRLLAKKSTVTQALTFPTYASHWEKEPESSRPAAPLASLCPLLACDGQLTSPGHPHTCNATGQQVTSGNR